MNLLRTLAAGALLALAAGGCRPARNAPPPADPAAAAKLAELDALLRAGRDDDPRLDADFNALTPEMKRLFRARYASLAPELLNQRGTVVFLLGRNKLDADDWAFLRAVVSEPPCLSLADCARAPRSGGSEAVGDAVTLAYPALVALTQAEDRFGDPAAAADIRSVVDAARKSASRAVARKAEALALKLR